MTIAAENFGRGQDRPRDDQGRFMSDDEQRGGYDDSRYGPAWLRTRLPG
jgi:hypothetical protein